MALTGLQIYKMLPQTNCGECNYPTCLAFAMKLAAMQAELADCPYVSDEAKSQLEAASAPPIRLVTIGSNGNSVSAGNETVLFRHEKTFYHAPGLFVRVRDTQPEADVVQTAKQVEEYVVDYVGIDLSFSGMAVQSDSGDADAFRECVSAVRSANSGALILIGEDADVLRAGLSAAGSRAGGEAKPLLGVATSENWQSMAALAKEQGLPLVVRAERLDELSQLTQSIRGAGVEDLVLDPMSYGFGASLVAMTEIRRLALKHGQRDLGYPIIAFAGEGATDNEDEAALVAQAIAKYAGFIVLDQFSPATAYPLLVLRQNIFTDPQKPIQVKPGMYEINDPTPDSPLMVTTNFSITYFSVANEIAGSGMPGWLLVADAEGMSVLTAWAAGKFDASTIAKGIQATNAADKVAHRRLIIPGQVAVLSGDLEEELPGWEILVGPREAVDLTSYLRIVA